MEKDRDDCIRKLIDIQYVRNDQDFKRGTFRVRGDVVEVYPSSSSGDAIRVEFFGDEVDRISEIDSLTGEVKGVLEHMRYSLTHIMLLRRRRWTLRLRISGQSLPRE